MNTDKQNVSTEMPTVPAVAAIERFRTWIENKSTDYEPHKDDLRTQAILQKHLFRIENLAPLRDQIHSALPSPHLETIRNETLNPRLRD